MIHIKEVVVSFKYKPQQKQELKLDIQDLVELVTDQVLEKLENESY